MTDGTRLDDADRGPPALLVSACLLGEACNFRGGASPRTAVAGLGERYRLVAVCPEVVGGLPVPRPPAELTRDGRACTVDGTDVTAEYRLGAEVAVDLARTNAVLGAVLKARSPSCGSRQVYDGTFTGTLRSGEGVTAAALRAEGVEVVDEDDVSGGWLPEPDR